MRKWISEPPVNYPQRFRLRGRVQAVTRQLNGETAGFIYNTFPLYVSKTTPQIIQLLQTLNGELTVSEVSRLLKTSPKSILKILTELENRLLVENVTPPTTGKIIYYNSDEDLPTVTILVPVYNRPKEIKTCLESLLKLDYPIAKREIIVVDDASSDDTVAVIAQFPVKLLQNERNLGPAGSRNRALGEAQGELIAFVDSDCTVTSDWLRQIVPGFLSQNIAAIGGKTEAIYDLGNSGSVKEKKSEFFSKLASVVADLRNSKLNAKSLFLSPFSSLLAPLISRYEDAKSALTFGEKAQEVRLDSAINYLPTCNLVVRKKLILEQGKFDPAMRFGEDVDLCWRLLKQGQRIRYQPAALIGHAFRTSLRGFLKTRHDYATSEAFLVARHPEKRRTFYVQGVAGLVWLGGFVSLAAKNPLPLLLSLTVPLWSGITKWRGIRRWHLPVSLKDVLFSEARTIAISGYHMGTHTARYYSVPLLALLLPKRTRLSALIVLIAPLIADYYRRQTKLNPLVFILLNLLENGAYQVGLVSGCRKEGHATALLPKIKVQWF